MKSFSAMRAATRSSRGRRASRLMAAHRAAAGHRLALAQFRPGVTVEAHEGEADHRHDEGPRHAIKVADMAHQLGQDRAAHDGHDDEGRGLLRPRAQPVDAQREDGREHDRHEEVAQEHADHRDPAQLENHEQADDDVDQRHTGRAPCGRQNFLRMAAPLNRPTRKQTKPSEARLDAPGR